MIVELLSALAVSQACPSSDPISLDKAIALGLSDDAIEYGSDFIDQIATLRFEPVNDEILPSASLHLRELHIEIDGDESALTCLFNLQAQQEFSTSRTGPAYLADPQTGEFYQITIIVADQIQLRNQRWVTEYLTENGWSFEGDQCGFAPFTAFALILGLRDNVDIADMVVDAVGGQPQSADDRLMVVYLSDIVSVGREQPQLYGTRTACQPDGTWGLFPIEGTLNDVNQRRADVGLPHLADPTRNDEFCATLANFTVQRQ